MPLRQRISKPAKHVTLNEALNWIAFDSFDGPELTDSEVQIGIFGDCDNLEAIEIAQYQRRQALEAAESDLFSALRDGDIEAHGFKGTQWTTESPWHAHSYSNHIDTREQIPPDFWRHDGVQWDRNVAKGTTCEYIEVILDRLKVLKVWSLEVEQPTAEIPADGKASSASRGRRPTYRENEFLAICACEASANGLPDIQAEFVKVMSEMLSAIWGEDQTPSETWLKEKTRPIYEQRAGYEIGRQLLQGKNISRPK